MADLVSLFHRRMKERAPIVASSGMQLRMGCGPAAGRADRPRLGRGTTAGAASGEATSVTPVPCAPSAPSVPRPAQASLPPSTGVTIVGRREELLLPPLAAASRAQLPSPSAVSGAPPPLPPSAAASGAALFSLSATAADDPTARSDDSVTQIQARPVLPVGAAPPDPEKHRITARVAAIAEIPCAPSSALSIEIEVEDPDEDGSVDDVTVPRYRPPAALADSAGDAGHALDSAVDDLLLRLEWSG